MTAPRAIIFDLGGTLVHWPKWEEDAPTKWAAAFHTVRMASSASPTRDDFVAAMRAAEKAHWERVDREHWSGPPTGLVSDGFRRLGMSADDALLIETMDAYAKAVAGWSTVFPDTRETLLTLRERGYSTSSCTRPTCRTPSRTRRSSVRSGIASVSRRRPA
ncbi:MAG: hypothetical protein AUH85_08080 [Chloroflexi bacterium 13_1_40CM_4_68_4]|nr:MAG: hypothetical protein AUH85_08080 [Chloroflexi bacterium 13_1_40CM_4_68_4]